MKYLILDAGPIISLTMNGMLHILEKLRKSFDGEFIITPAVKREVIDRPIKIKKYKLEALQVQDLIRRGVIKLSKEVVSDNKLEKETKKILNTTNGVLRITDSGKKINIIHEGEASCLAFANLCKGENLIVIDERTTRLLIEAPKNLEKLMEKKLHTPITSEFSLLNKLKNFKFIRSSELIYIAFKKRLIPIGTDKETLDALLYGLKFKGTAIASREIEEMKSMV